MTRRLFVLAAALAAAGPAAAGPMSWSFTATVLAGDGASAPPAAAVLSLGRWDAADNKLGAAWAALPDGHSGVMDGSGTITLASSAKDAYTRANDLPANAVDRFRVLLQITDGATGIRGFTYATGGGSLTGGDAAGAELELTGTGRVLLQLGEHRYDFRWRPDQTEGASRMVADVTVTGLVATTPEPASLALGGMGLAVVGLRRLRRRG